MKLDHLDQQLIRMDGVLKRRKNRLYERKGRQLSTCIMDSPWNRKLAWQT
jgi:hypothetical protein